MLRGSLISFPTRCGPRRRRRRRKRRACWQNARRVRRPCAVGGVRSVGRAAAARTSRGANAPVPLNRELDHARVQRALEEEGRARLQTRDLAQQQYSTVGIFAAFLLKFICRGLRRKGAAPGHCGYCMRDRRAERTARQT